MWVSIRTFDGAKKSDIQNLSKLTKVEDLRTKIAEVFDAPVSHQCLYYGGKLLVDGHTLFDYNIGIADTIQLMVRSPVISNTKTVTQSLNENEEQVANGGAANNKENFSLAKEAEATKLNQSKYFKIGDFVDAKYKEQGSWFEGTILSILKYPPSEDKILQSVDENGEMDHQDNAAGDEDKNIVYTVSFDGFEDDVKTLKLDDIRPRATKKLEFEQISEGDRVMVNYNMEDSDEPGFWYDCVVTEKQSKRSSKFLIGTILIKQGNTELQSCKIKFVEGEVFAIEETTPLCDRKFEIKKEMISRNKKLVCRICKDLEKVKCKQCGCSICGGKEEENKLILCDECDCGYHIWCLSPPLASVPDDEEWYCPKCKNDTSGVIKPGEKLKVSKKKSQMASHSSTSSRDWGKGMACAGRTTQCTIVPSDHFGPIPGIDVGTLWKFRLQVSESGVHRPHVAGIHGRENTGAFSIVLSGGYAEDEDHGDSFTYTGSGGRDLSGNKREGKQTHDQVLTRMNKALAMSCAANFNKLGAEAKNWRDGKPIRVVRNYKAAKHSKYAPKVGNRYDGIYKIAKYWPEKGESGFIVWRYLFHYADSTPLPWTKAGMKRARELGLQMQYPVGYVEDDDVKKAKKGKHALADDEEPSPKKKTKIIFCLPDEIKDLIDKDSVDKKIWDECLKIVPEGNTTFLASVTENFSCICCQELVFNPVTTHCCHNICKVCLKNSFRAEVYSCPVCRAPLDKKKTFQVNEALALILLKLFPGYGKRR